MSSESFKSEVDKLVYKYLSRERSTAASIIISGVQAGYDKKKLTDKLVPVADKTLAHKLADKVMYYKCCSITIETLIKIATKKKKLIVQKLKWKE